MRESIVRLLTAALFRTYKPSEHSDWLNTGADLFSPEEAIDSIRLMTKQCKSSVIDSAQNSVLPQNCDIIRASTFDELKTLLDNRTVDNKRFKFDEQIKEKMISTESIMNCILHPDVIELIAQKLKQISFDTSNYSKPDN